MVVQKGSADTISDGKHTIACTREGSPRRAGGQVHLSAVLASCDCGMILVTWTPLLRASLCSGSSATRDLHLW